MKRVFLLSVYISLVIIFPNGMGIKTVIDLRVWMIFAAVLLLPSFANEIFSKKFQFNQVDLIIIFLVLLSSFSSLFSGSNKEFIGRIVKGFLYMFLPYFAGRYFIKSRKELKIFFFTLILTSIIVSLIALNEYSAGKSFFGNFAMINPDALWSNSQVVYQRFGHFRIAASFSQPIYLGVFLANFLTLDKDLASGC